MIVVERTMFETAAAAATATAEPSTTKRRDECTMVTVGSSKAAYYYCGEAIPQPATAYCCPDTKNNHNNAVNGVTPSNTNKNNTTGRLLFPTSVFSALTSDASPSPGDAIYYYDPYQVLHLRRDATSEEITMAYRRFAVLRHPSRCASPSSTTSTTNGVMILPLSLQFAAVSAAYETLSITETRQRMDLILNGRGGAQYWSSSSAKEEQRRHDEGWDTRSASHVIKSRLPDRTHQELEFRQQLQRQRRQALRQRKETKRLDKLKRRGIRGMVTTAVENRRKGKSPTKATPRLLAGPNAKEVSPPKREFTAPVTNVRQRIQVSSVSERYDENDNSVTGSIEAGDSSFSTDDGDDDNDTNYAPDVAHQMESIRAQSNVSNSDLPRNIYTSTTPPPATASNSSSSCLPPLHAYTGCIPMEDSDYDKEKQIGLSESNGTMSSVSRIAKSVHSGVSTKANAQNSNVKAKSKTARRTAKFPRSLPALVQSSTSCSTTREDVQHYSSTTAERLFGGPLQLMYQARRWKNFSDPHVVFERVFGSALLGNRDISCAVKNDAEYLTVLDVSTNQNTTAAAVVASASPSAWAGTTETLVDGTVVNVKSRVIQNAQGHRRLMKRTVTRLPADPNSGLCRTTIAVTSVDLNEPDRETNDAKGNRTTSLPTPCSPEICANNGSDAHTIKSLPSKACPASDDVLNDAGTAATAADDDWSFASMCQAWLSPCCG